MPLSLASLAHAEDGIFDVHVHIWNGEKSVKECLALEFRFWNIIPLGRTAKDLMADNFHFDISAAVVLAADSPLEDEFVWTMRNVGIDDLLLGSDFPQLSLPQTLDALERLKLTEEEKRKLRWENANRWCGLDQARAQTK
jgi:predicted TIM-barrel fold metal-dependent hydrolase